MLTITPWSLSRAILLLFLFEGILTGTVLVFSATGYPDLTRMALWKEGGIKHFNSNPALRIYFYANHKEPPPIPYIWSRVQVLSITLFLEMSDT